MSKKKIFHQLEKLIKFQTLLLFVYLRFTGPLYLY